MKLNTSNARFRVFMLLVCTVALVAFGNVLLTRSSSAHLLKLNTTPTTVTADKSDYLPGETATASFAVGPGDGVGRVTVTSADGSCFTGTAPNGGGPFDWEVVQGGNYIMTINGVAECSGDSIKVFIQSTDTGNFCITLNKTAPGTYSGPFTMPNPACFTYPVSYKCDANAGCDNSNTFNAQGPNGEGSVHLRSSIFTDGCVSHVNDIDCTAPTPSPTPTATPTPKKVCPIGCPADVTVECGDSTEPGFTGTATSDGDCTISHNDAFVPGSCANTGVITRIWKATSADGTETVCTQKITIVDTRKPTISGAGANATIDCPNTPQFTPPTASDSCGSATVVEEPEVRVDGSCPNTYTLTKTWHAEDACGNKSDPVSQTITVVDTTKPTIGAPGADATIECTDTPQFTPPTASDSCGGATVIEDSDVKTPGDCPNAFTETKTWHAEDACGNKSDPVSQTIKVVDTTKPTIGQPGANATIECPNTPVFTAPTATDNCGDAHVIEDSDNTVPGSCPNTYSRTKTWHAEDDCGNKSATVSQTITVEDKTPPTISEAGSNGTIECPNQPVFTPPTASDSCGNAHVIEDSDVTTPGSCANTYSRTKTWHAEDDCGNRSGSKSQTIAVIDTTAPVIGEAGANKTIYCPTAPVFTPPTASDSCGAATVVEVSDVTTTASCDTYRRTKTWVARDACGNQSGQKSQTIIVECNNCGEGTMGFWQNKNGQALIKSANQASLSNYLMGFAPFQDLAPQVVATYVTNVVKAASASGAAMNAMLKAQMLSTALDVYFGKVLGTANIDLTQLGVSSSFGGASCMSINGMLSYAASRSNSGGTIWYNQVKSGPNSQELAKNAFDAINNEKAFSVFSCP